jgi:ssDNA-binding replication factor A large subunit
MNISDLKSGMSSVDVKAKVTALSAPREVQTKYGPNSVADATLKDDTGTITLTLWGARFLQ